MACPICDKETNATFRPFCSKRCADVDLAKWLGGSYAIPSENPDDFDELIDELENAKPKKHRQDYLNDQSNFNFDHLF